MSEFIKHDLEYIRQVVQDLIHQTAHQEPELPDIIHEPKGLPVDVGALIRWHKEYGYQAYQASCRKIDRWLFSLRSEQIRQIIPMTNGDERAKDLALRQITALNISQRASEKVLGYFEMTVRAANIAVDILSELRQAEASDTEDEMQQTLSQRNNDEPANKLIV